MVSWSLLLEHGWAFALLWGWATLAGCALLPWLRVGVGFVGAPLLGIVYWTLALYLLPFAGGLDLAAGVVAALALLHLYRCWRASAWTPVWRRVSWSTLILTLGSLPFMATLFYHHVPGGMDASMHTTAAALIARSRGLPVDCAPFAADVPFLAVNLGLSSVAALAIRCGGEPAAVMLAAHHFTFTCLILATYLLLRRGTFRTSAAVIAVASVWLARSSQSSLGWGGYPTVLSVAAGVFAARLLLQLAQSASWRLSVTTGAAVAAIPLIHGVGGATWIYCVGLWIGIATVRRARCVAATMRGFAIAGTCAGVLLFVYRISVTLDVQAAEIKATHAFVQQFAPAEAGWRAWPAALAFVRKDAGSWIVLAGWAACGVLVLRRRWSTAFLLVTGWLALTTVVANARWLMLPGSFLLYPERALYWAGPLSALGLALAWRSLPVAWRQSRCMVVPALGLLLLAGYSHNHFYQRIVRANTIGHDAWEALVWAREHLQPHQHFVLTEYNSAGSYLPSVAQIDCSGPHYHHFAARAVQRAHARRTATHRLIETKSLDPPTPGTGRIVFRNASFTIVELPGVQARRPNES